MSLTADDFKRRLMLGSDESYKYEPYGNSPMRRLRWEVVIMKLDDTNERVYFESREEADAYMDACPEPTVLFDKDSPELPQPENDA